MTYYIGHSWVVNREQRDASTITYPPTSIEDGDRLDAPFCPLVANGFTPNRRSAFPVQSLQGDRYSRANPNVTMATAHLTSVDRPSRAKESRVQYGFFLAIGAGLLWITLPWLAPIFMKMGWGGAANAIYTLYSVQCHQLAQRSFFLFGPQTMYSLDQFNTFGLDTSDIMALREFIGSAELGYKVAWSDRMVSAYSSIPLIGLLWWPFRHRMRPLRLLGLFLLLMPMVLDGGSHFISDLAGVGQGFRYANEWLVTVSGDRFPAIFYEGNGIGSFNSWMRMVTGVLFGLGFVWFTFPHLLNIGLELVAEGNSRSPRSR
jgi:uncharacterized membrane protein